MIWILTEQVSSAAPFVIALVWNVDVVWKQRATCGIEPSAKPMQNLYICEDFRGHLLEPGPINGYTTS